MSTTERHAILGAEDREIEMDDDARVFSNMMTRVEHGIEKIGHRIGDLVDHRVDDIERITDKVEESVESFVATLALSSIKCHSHNQSDTGNLGNNVHLTNQNGAPYRFGLHIKRDGLGFCIARIFEDTIAHRAKLQENDILVRLNDIDLCSTNIVKVITLFAGVGNPFSLTILRDTGSGERIEITVRISITIDEVGKSVEIEVTYLRINRKYTLDINYTPTPFYVTHDPDEGSQQYVNISRDGTLIMGNERVKFVFAKYLTIDYGDESEPSILKTEDGNRAFNFTEQKMTTFNARDIEPYLLNVTPGLDNSTVMERLNSRDRDSSRHFLNIRDGEIIVSTFENPESVPSSGRFVIYSADDYATTATDRELRRTPMRNRNPPM